MNRGNYGEIIKSINNLENRIDIDATFREFSPVCATVQKLLDSRKVKNILKLKLQSRWTDSEFKSSLCDPKIHELELYNCDVSLEALLLDDDFKGLKNKVSMLEVSSVGNIDGRIADADLKDLRIERLLIIFNGIHPENMQRIVDLLREQARAMILRNFEPSVSTENVDYLGICGGYFYELHYNE